MLLNLPYQPAESIKKVYGAQYWVGALRGIYGQDRIIDFIIIQIK